MEIQFDTKELRDICEQEAVAIELLGVMAAETLIRRLADLRAAEAISDVVAGNPQLGEHGELECFRLSLAEESVLVLTPNHSKPRLDNAGKTDWPMVRRVRVVSLKG